jgi:gluconate:H+ symporter, GntP family
VWWGSYIGNRLFIEVPDDFVVAELEREAQDGDPATDPDAGPGGGTATAVRTQPPTVGLIASVILVPMVLILGATVGTVVLPKDSGALSVLLFLGTPAIALTIAVLLAMYLLGTRRGISVVELGRITGESLRPIGMILLVIGAGAFFGAVLQATGVGKALAGSMTEIGLPVILSAYLISSALRLAQGSATVAIVTTAGIVEPIVAAGGYSQAQIALIVIAVSAGSIIASHVNDGGFWIVSKYFNMSVKDTLKTWTVLETILSVVGFAMAGLLWLVV